MINYSFIATYYLYIYLIVHFTCRTQSLAII